ncbi:hypothetical protein ACHHYP_03554 [Achlya hypogyna]|uniref:Uncharacterized protein n=1 Tax=Achlya hypogyna TaxID=1202772 RepID=A0A1V9ZR27_ACHHY|nr:hypothetical protein ACHHYP_03554 [Achlya hypogyna]
MDESTKVMVVSAALQSRTTVPLARHCDAVSSQYRFMDAESSAREIDERARIIRELEAKRSKTKGSGTKTAFESALEVHGTSRRRSEHRPAAPRAPPVENQCDNDARVTIEELKAEVARLKRSNNAEAIQKIAAFKKAQERDLAAVERLIQEKCEAEAKARRLEALLQEQAPKVHPYNSQSRKPELVIDASESFFNDVHGDEATPPAFDGPQTASSIDEHEELPGFPSSSPEKSRSPVKIPTKRSLKVVPDDDPVPSTWATRISSTCCYKDSVSSPAVIVYTRRSSLTRCTRTSSGEAPSSKSCEAIDRWFLIHNQEGAGTERARSPGRRSEGSARAGQARNAPRWYPLAPGSTLWMDVGLLENEARTRERKTKRLQAVADAVSQEHQQFKAREPPVFAPTDAQVAELARQRRVAERAAALLAQSQLPPRMAVERPKKVPSTEVPVRIKAQPVPDFHAMQTKWKTALQRAKGRRTTTAVAEFSLTRPEKVEILARKRLERQERLTAKEHAEQLEAKEAARRQALEAAMVAAKATARVSTTASHTLRTKAVQAKLKLRQKRDESQEAALVAKNEKLKAIAKKVSAEVSDSERRRKEEKGNYVEDPAAAAKAKAEDDKRAFKEALKRNRERIHAAAAARPSLMERFAIDKKKEEHKRKALEAVVSNVFGKNLGAFRGVFTEEEEELVANMDAPADVAAADKQTDDEYNDED